jgi:predicted AlkP superfamily pyrophosphatase or phosphodiesterase
MKWYIILLLCVSPLVWGQMPKDVIIIGVDGFASSCMEQATPPSTPILDFLKTHGSWTYEARSQWLAESSTNWGAIGTANPATITGINSNVWGWGLRGAFYDPTDREECLFGANLFHAYKAYGGATTENTLISDATFIEKLYKYGPIDNYVLTHDDVATETEAAAYLQTVSTPYTLFAYFNNLDEAGHSSKFCGSKYDSAVERLDGRIGRVLVAVENASVRRASRPFIAVIVSDHGGYQYTHELVFSPASFRTPLFFYGSGIKANYEILTEPVNTIQTMPTIFAIMGLNPPLEWSSKPIMTVPLVPPAISEGISILDARRTSVYLADCRFQYPYYADIVFTSLPFLLAGLLLVTCMCGYSCRYIHEKKVTWHWLIFHKEKVQFKPLNKM